MKRLNYYQVHKNKKPRRLKRPKRKVSHIPLIVIIAAMGAIRIATIQHSLFTNPHEKALKMVISAAETSLAISDVLNKMKNINPKKLYYETHYKAKADPGLRFKKRKPDYQKAGN